MQTKYIIEGKKILLLIRKSEKKPTVNHLLTYLSNSSAKNWDLDLVKKTLQLLISKDTIDSNYNPVNHISPPCST